MRSKRFLYTSALYRAEGGEPPRGSPWNKDTCAHTDMAALCKGKWTRLELPGGGELLCSLCSRPAKAVWLLLLKLYLSNRSRRLSTPSWCIALSTLQNACVRWDGFQISRFKQPQMLNQTERISHKQILGYINVLPWYCRALKHSSMSV